MRSFIKPLSKQHRVLPVINSKSVWEYKSWDSYARPLAAGLLVAAGLPPWGWWPLLILGLLYWLHLLDTPRWQSRFMFSFLVAVGWFLPSLLWIWDLSALGYLVVVLIFGVMYGVGGIAVPPKSVSHIPAILTFPAMVILLEHIRGRWPFGGVPLSTLAMGLVDSYFSHTVRFLGSLFLVFLVAVLVTGISLVLARNYLVGALIVLGVILATLFLGFAPSTSSTGESLEIAIVQGGGPQRVRERDSNPREVFNRHINASGNVQKPIDLVVWPENAIDVSRFSGSFEEASLIELAGELDAYLYVGVVEDVDSDTFANYSVLFSPQGEQIDLYEKVRRVPFGEFVPFRSLVEPLAPSFLPGTEARVGTGEAVVSDGEHIFGTAISWEIFFEDRVRSAARSGAEVIINPTNNSTYWLSIVQSQQIASSKLRAQETGLWVVQAAPTGFSAFVSPTGEVVQKISIGTQETIQMSVELRSGETLATKLGVWPMVGLALFLLLLGWGIYLHRRFS